MNVVESLTLLSILVQMDVIESVDVFPWVDVGTTPIKVYLLVAMENR